MVRGRRLAILALIGSAGFVLSGTALFVCIARGFGMSIRGITLFVFGGVAQIGREPDRPMTEFQIAVAGPLYLGRTLYGTYWDGTLDDVRIYARALAGAEIAERAQPSGGPPEACGPDSSKFADDFPARAYTGSTGDRSWSGPWLEVGESDGPASGDELVMTRGTTNWVLRVRDNNNGGEGVMREANLAGLARATLAFKAWRESLDNANDYARVQISANGGVSWTEIDRIVGPGTDNNLTPLYGSYDISGFIAPNTRFRFMTSPDMGDNDSVYFDEVQICVE